MSPSIDSSLAVWNAAREEAVILSGLLARAQWMRGVAVFAMQDRLDLTITKLRERRIVISQHENVAISALFEATEPYYQSPHGV